MSIIVTCCHLLQLFNIKCAVSAPSKLYYTYLKQRYY